MIIVYILSYFIDCIEIGSISPNLLKTSKLIFEIEHHMVKKGHDLRQFTITPQQNTCIVYNYLLHSIRKLCRIQHVVV